MKRMHAAGVLWLIALVSLLLAHPVATAAAPSPAPEVTYDSLYELEAFWPYHVRLTEDWRPEGFAGERFSYGIGVLVRVEASGLLRVDFARFGRHLVPARVTNVLEAANRIRRGEVGKPTPNFVQAVGRRLHDPSNARLRPLRPDAFGQTRAFVVVAADPSAESFPEIAAALETIRQRPGVVPLLFPQGGHKDGAVWQLCRRAGWADPFLYDRFVVPLTDSFLGEDARLPAVLLTSPEGRVILSSSWSEETAGALAAALDRELDEAI